MSLNPLYMLLVVPMVLAWWSQIKVRKVYEDDSVKPNDHGLKGEKSQAVIGSPGDIRRENRKGTRLPDRPL